MLAATRNKRFFEITQVMLAFISTCTVVDSAITQAMPSRPGFSSSVPLRATSGDDRRFSDLARSDRKRREAEQQASRRGAARAAAVAQRLPDPLE